MPFSFGDNKTGHFDDCVKYYMGKKSKRSGKNYTKDEASAVCATIMRGQEKMSEETKEILAQVTAMEAERKKLGMTEAEFYAFPRLHKLPIFDEAHVRAAMSRFNQTQGWSDGEKSSAKSKIMSAAKKFGIEPGEFKSLSQEQPTDATKTIEKPVDVPALFSGKFTLSLHQLGNAKHFDLFLEKDGYCDDFAFTPAKAAEKNILKSGDRAQKRNVVNLKMLDFTGVITTGKPGASKDFPGLLKVLERGTYDTLEEGGGIFKYKLNGKKLNGTFQFLFDTEKLQENFKYRYIFTQLDGKDELISTLMSQIEELALPPERTPESLSIQQEVGVLKELLKDGNVIPLTIRGVALKEGIWNGLYYPYEEIQKAAMGLVGKPLMMDHGKGIRDMAGKITGITLDDANRSMNFEAQIIDENAARKVLEGLVNSVSVGVIVDRIKESIGLTARNYEWKELSILSILNDPACKDAKIKEVVPPVQAIETPSLKAQ